MSSAQAILSGDFLTGVKMRYTGLVIDALDEGVDINAVDSHGRTCLHYAVLKIEESGTRDAVDKLKKSFSRLFSSVCGRRNFPSVVYAMERFDSKDHEKSPDMHIDLVEFLINAGAKVNAVDKDDNSCLHYAVENEDCLEFISLFLGCGLEIDAKNRDGYTPLLIAVQHDNLEAVEKLVSLGANVKLKTRSNETCLHIARSDEMIRLLLDSGATDLLIVSNKNRGKGPFNRTPFQSVLRYCRVDTLERMIKSGADVNFENKGHCMLEVATPLRAAITTRREEIVEALLKHGANPNYVELDQFSRKTSELDYAIERESSFPIIKLLISYGADYSDPWLFERVLWSGNLEVVQLFFELFKQKGFQKPHEIIDGPLLHAALMNNNADVFSYILELQSGSLEVPNQSGRTVLHQAIASCIGSSCRGERAAFLLDLGANINSVSPKCDNETILNRAIENGCVSCMELLLCYGSLPDSLLKISDSDLYYDPHGLVSEEDRSKNVDQVIMFLCLMEKLGHPVELEFFEEVKEEGTESRKFYEICRAELELMSEIYVQDSITIYDVLSGKDFDSHASNSTLINNLKEQMSSLASPQKFPLYNSWIRRRLAQLETRNELVRKAKNGLRNILGFELDTLDHIYLNIFNHLTRMDLYFLQKI